MKKIKNNSLRTWPITAKPMRPISVTSKIRTTSDQMTYWLEQNRIQQLQMLYEHEDICYIYLHVHINILHWLKSLHPIQFNSNKTHTTTRRRIVLKPTSNAGKSCTSSQLWTINAPNNWNKFSNKLWYSTSHSYTTYFLVSQNTFNQ